jgi:hypothetical protein
MALLLCPADQVGLSDNVSDLYLGGDWFESWQYTNYSNPGCLQFFSVSSGLCWDITWNYTMSASFHILYVNYSRIILQVSAYVAELLAA